MCFSVKVVDDYGNEEGAFAEWAYGLRCIVIDHCLTPYNILSYLTVTPDNLDFSKKSNLLAEWRIMETTRDVEYGVLRSIILQAQF
jgi:hypothetical protein